MPILTASPPCPGDAPVVPRADGSAVLHVGANAGRSGLRRLQTAGCLKLLFPQKPDRVEAIAINTAGGLTGGDRLRLNVEVGSGAVLSVTTQAAERVYRAQSGTARVRSDLRVNAGARLLWLPQELILYDGAALDRRLRVDLGARARLLLVEPMIFGRHAMGEVLRHGHFRDRIEVTRDGAPAYLDGIDLSGDIAARLGSVGTGDGAGAMASVVYVARDAEAHLSALRPALPAAAGASLLADDMMVMRFLAHDGFALRQALLPVLDRLSQETLPASWRL